MRNELEIYDWLLQAPDRPAAVGILSDDELARVGGWLRMNYDENTSSGELLGICLVVASDRWSRQVMAKKNAGGAE